jgi:hypothetical protein
MHRSNTDQGQPRRSPIKREPTAVRRRNAAHGQHPRPPREEQYNSEFITRYGDPFD